jgi:hypothetical protein
MATGTNNSEPIAPKIKPFIVLTLPQANELLNILADLPIRHKLLVDKVQQFLLEKFLTPPETNEEAQDALPLKFSGSTDTNC